MKTVFLIHQFSTLFMTGVIWFAQVAHYPLLGRVGKEAFAAPEQENTRRTGWVVIPVMAVELMTALLLLWRQVMSYSAQNIIPARRSRRRKGTNEVFL